MSHVQHWLLLFILSKDSFCVYTEVIWGLEVILCTRSSHSSMACTKDGTCHREKKVTLYKVPH